MAMGSLGKAIKATRAKMLDEEAESIASEFTRRFGMRDGDYIRFGRHSSSNTEISTLGRIVSVEYVFYNQRGGYTASVKVAPLLVGGKIGNTRSVVMTVNANGTGLHGIGRFVERVSEQRDRRA